MSDDVLIATVAVAAIVLDRELQPRAIESPHLVREYTLAIEAGAKFPPIVCFRIDGQLLLADGWHRLAAQKRLSRTEVEVDVREGDRDQAILFSREYNSMHGARFTTADKQRAILTYLNHERFSRWPDREIGRRLGVDHKSVGKYRAELDGVPKVGKSPPDWGSSPATSPLQTERQAQTRSMSVIAAYRAALDALTAAEGAERVQTEIGKWWSAISGGGLVRFDSPRRR